MPNSQQKKEKTKEIIETITIKCWLTDEVNSEAIGEKIKRKRRKLNLAMRLYSFFICPISPNQEAVSDDEWEELKNEFFCCWGGEGDGGIWHMGFP